jgi:hypothetical protein
MPDLLSGGENADLSNLVSLARRDPRRAARALGAQPHEVQVDVICQVPPRDRPKLLEELPEPERIIAALPEGELCFMLKATGIHDSAWIVEYANDEQMISCVDLDAWADLELDPEKLHRWFRCFLEAGDETILRIADALDPEVCVFWLQDRMVVVQRTVQEAEFEAPLGAKTLDGTYFLVAKRDGDDLATPLRMLTLLYEAQHDAYERLMLATIFEMPSDNLEWALRWRSGRLADLGFPTRRETLGLYAPLRPGEVERAAPSAQKTESWRLPVRVPPLPEATQDAPAIFRAAAEFSSEEDRRAFLFSLLALANAVAVADRLPLGDAESVPSAMEKAAETASRGMAEIARRRSQTPREVLETTSLPFLFRVGHALDRGQAAK